MSVLGPQCFRRAIHPELPKKIKGSVGRNCSCGITLRLPIDVVEVEPPDPNGGSDLPDPPKRAIRRKYVRPPGEKPNLSTKMQFLHDDLLSFSRRNPNSQHYDPFALDIGDVEELDTSGQPFVTKSVVL